MSKKQRDVKKMIEKRRYEGDILTDEGSFENDCWDYGNIEFDKEDYTYYISWTIEDVLEPITACCDYAVSGNEYEGNY